MTMRTIECFVHSRDSKHNDRRIVVADVDGAFRVEIEDESIEVPATDDEAPEPIVIDVWELPLREDDPELAAAESRSRRSHKRRAAARASENE